MNLQDNPLSRMRVADLKFATAHFEALQGLAILPGLVFMTGFFAFAAWADDRFAGSLLWVIGGGAGIAVALLLGALITRWYRRTYGELAPAGTGRSTRWVAAVAALIVLVAIARTIPVASISLEGLVVGTALLALGWVLRASFGPILLPAGAVIVVAGLLPLGGWLDLPEHPLGHTEALLSVVCFVWIVAAIRSHVILTRILRPRR